jgi:prophage DNA circulation protein
MMEGVRAACSDPADAVRLLSVLAQTIPAVSAPNAPIGSAVAATENAVNALCTQAALTSLARACASYQPSSANDAMALLQAVVPLYDAQIESAADAGQGGVYAALRTLRAGVIQDLTTRGAQLPQLVTINTAVPTPSLTLAYRLYADATRAEELTARSNAQASLFLPTSFQVLSS